MVKKIGIPTFQIGKNGVTEGTIKLLETAFKGGNQVKMAMMRGAGHTKEDTRAAGEKLIEMLGKNYTYKTLGFTIFLQKWRREMR